MPTSHVAAAPGGIAGSYLIQAIDQGVLAALRTADDAGNAPRLVTDAEGGQPLRCCLRMTIPGERVALASYAPLRRWARSCGADPGPYDEVGPVFIHPGACPGPAGAGLPAELLRSPRVFRGYSARGHILGGWPFGVDGAGAAVGGAGRAGVGGDGAGRAGAAGSRGGGAGDLAGAEALLGKVYADPEVALVHVRTLGFGCFLFEVHRPQGPAR